jgi:Flp pilus assembly secretin CpaC
MNRNHKGSGGFPMTAIPRILALGASLLLTAGPAARAQDQAVVLEFGIDSTLVLDRPFDTILIADSDIVDVHPRNDRSIVMEPLNSGSTNLIFLDNQHIVIANVPILVRKSGPAASTTLPAGELALRPY